MEKGPETFRDDKLESKGEANIDREKAFGYIPSMSISSEQTPNSSRKS